jgi:hypothetical protein
MIQPLAASHAVAASRAMVSLGGRSSLPGSSARSRSV